VEKDNKIKVDDDNDEDEVETQHGEQQQWPLCRNRQWCNFEPNGGFDDGIPNNEIGDDKKSDNNKIEADNDNHDMVPPK
jgi:hypothetical protein